MPRFFAPAAVALAFTLGVAQPVPVFAHCQVPCGIYGDELKLAELAQHVETVQKAATQIQALAGKTDAQSVQQVVRWTHNKEAHAELIMTAMQSYFLAQRVKLPAADASDADKQAYFVKLHQIHAVIVHAMKVKQNADTAHGQALGQALEAFKGSYLGVHAGHGH